MAHDALARDVVQLIIDPFLDQSDHRHRVGNDLRERLDVVAGVLSGVPATEASTRCARPLLRRADRDVCGTEAGKAPSAE
jgi:hypothetical protein